MNDPRCVLALAQGSGHITGCRCKEEPPLKTDGDISEYEQTVRKQGAVVNPRHLSGSVDWWTPPYIIDASRRALGGTIDLDPASSPEANVKIRAKRIYTEEQDGLAFPWEGRIFLNPPGGKMGTASRQKLFWQKLVYDWQKGRITAAVFLSFSIELFQTSQVKPLGLPTPHDFTVCFPARRIAYLKEGSIFSHSPPHSSALIYLGPSPALFADAMKSIGRCMGPLMLPAASIH